MRLKTVLSALLLAGAAPLLACNQADDRSADALGESGAAINQEMEADRMTRIAARLAQDPPANQLTAEEQAAGWKLLFDGTLEGWRGYRRDGVPGGWSAREGALAFTPGGGGGTLITSDQYADFELAFEWKIGEGGNSGVLFRATEDEVAPYWTGPEFQVLDNSGHRDGATPETSAGSNYALHAPTEDVTRPIGEWNRVRIIVRGPDVEHWMNGVRIVAYELWANDWRAMVERTKFAEWPRYGMAPAGHIGLQDHGDPVWYRNIKIRTF